MLKLKLRAEEKAALKLRSLYEEFGYAYYRMSRFEEYDFYAGKKDFLTSKRILTFTDINGKLMALRPDVTLSIIRHVKNLNDKSIHKFYYDEKVYRVPKNSNSFREISQAGLECIGGLRHENICEVIELAVMSLKTLSEGRRYILDVSHAGLISEILRGNQNVSEILKCLSEKNIHGLKEINAPEEIIKLSMIEGKPKEALKELEKITGRNNEMSEILRGLERFDSEINIDFSAVNNPNYYNGITFRGYIEGKSESVLSGGQYDKLMNMKYKALGFAVYLDEVTE